MEVSGQNSQSESGKHSDRIYLILKAQIIRSQIPAGTFLHESTLGLEYDMSRTPIREALLRLQEDGLIERKGRRLIVKSFGPTEVQEIFQFREALEIMVVRLCIERASEEDLDYIEQQLDEFDSLDHSHDRLEMHCIANQFHRALAKVSNNKLVIKNLYDLYETVAVIATLYWKEETSFECSKLDHRLILDAIRQKDIVLAEALMRAHLRRITILYE